MPKRTDIHKVMIIGSGPIVIGQACEFDYSGTQACKALRSLGYKIVLVNSNPATIMTDPGMADATYVEPLTVESLTKIIAKERPDALLPNLGGQSGLNLSSELAKAGVLDKYNVHVIGVHRDRAKPYCQQLRRSPGSRKADRPALRHPSRIHNGRNRRRICLQHGGILRNSETGA